MKILIVDDIPANLHLLRAILEQQSHEVLEASNGLEALAILEGELVDAIISDLLMPKMDGYRFCEEVRRNARLCHLPFIVYTSTYNSPGDEKLAFDMGADKYLRKPSPLKEIIGAVNEVLSRGIPASPRVASPDEDLRRSRLYNDTLLKKLEQKRRLISEYSVHLQASEERFRELSSNISDVLWSPNDDATPENGPNLSATDTAP